jgi:5-formyltetrahydrofolate cyclo-ligase
MQQSRFDIRHQMRQKRRSLPPRQKTSAARELARHVLQTRLFQQASRIACFISNDGEIDTEPLIRAAWQADKQIYLPVLASGGAPRLRFRPYRHDTAMQHNRYDIPEPAAGALLDGRQFDLVLMPLVAFDAYGNRLGMGGGYYDRTFAHLHQLQHRRPRLLGLAYAFQQVNMLAAQPWDVPLWAVATECGLRYFSDNNDGSDR